MISRTRARRPKVIIFGLTFLLAFYKIRSISTINLSNGILY